LKDLCEAKFNDAPDVPNQIMEPGMAQSNSSEALGDKIRFLFLLYPIFLVINLIVCWVMVHFGDIGSPLPQEYIYIFPPNLQYIESLTSFGFPKDAIAFVTISTANATVISLIFGFIYFLLTGVVPAYRARTNNKIDNVPFRIIGSMLAGLLFILLYLHVANFEDSYILYKLSIHRALIVSLLIISLFVYSGTMLLSLAAGLLCEKIIVFVLRVGDRKSW
jgi:ABC-type dipeptide/oligopeptide/nickel transport system permease subunit